MSEEILTNGENLLSNSINEVLTEKIKEANIDEGVILEVSQKVDEIQNLVSNQIIENEIIVPEVI